MRDLDCYGLVGCLGEARPLLTTIGFAGDCCEVKYGQIRQERANFRRAQGWLQCRLGLSESGPSGVKRRRGGMYSTGLQGADPLAQVSAVEVATRQGAQFDRVGDFHFLAFGSQQTVLLEAGEHPRDGFYRQAQVVADLVARHGQAELIG